MPIAFSGAEYFNGVCDLTSNELDARGAGLLADFLSKYFINLMNIFYQVSNNLVILLRYRPNRSASSGYELGRQRWLLLLPRRISIFWVSDF